MKNIHPLLIVYSFVILITAVLAYFSGNYGLMPLMNYFMGVSFLFLGIVKILSLNSFVSAYVKYDLVAKRFPFYAQVYPLVEIFIGAWFLFLGDNLVVDVLALIILLINFASIVSMLSNKEDIPCACLGSKYLVKFDKWILLENVLMILMMFYMTFLMIEHKSVSQVENKLENANVHEMHNMGDMKM